MSLQINESLELIIAYFLVLTIGVGHGANDLKIYFKSQSLTRIKSIQFVVIYAAAVILGFVAFFLIPDAVLVLFLIVSGFHFGQEHFDRYNLPQSVLNKLFVCFYGLTVIVALLYFNAVQSLPIIHDLIHSRITSLQLEVTLYIIAGIAFLLGVTQLRKLSLGFILKELLYLIILYVIFINSSLIWGFAIYFILWHSVPSIYHQIGHLNGVVTKSTLWDYVKSSLLYWIAALIFLGVLYYFLNEKGSLFLSVIVAFLGGITFPHVFVMHKIHSE